MVGMELDLALIVRQLPVESAYGLHALLPVLRRGRGGPPTRSIHSGSEHKNLEKC